ncbi:MULTISPECIES: transporter [unclassified Herbaspirillum]|uniref:SphA family protein n=1 Tax=unclassified Herbaspirillum TaxID=2624150 RepID=UPI00114DDDFA|nr:MULTISPECIES: transporter [unclassified Herbaspirillum]MBB5391247.1 hypothetical protein [Herbaspirillum sp. SJZ102]TQK13065.1 hypothetical protein FB599_0474 [Herbaspirillum sp. SJZ130]TQK15069.1 hypothetical protein FB598_0412 [Herbaspirillum sp. SJZ106]
MQVPSGKRRAFRHLILITLIGASLALGADHALAQASGIAPTVSQPQGLNLGETSFMDGFSRTEPGWVYLPALRYSNGNAIKDGSGRDSAAFKDPRIDALTLVNHLSYTSPIRIGNATLGMNAILPVVYLDGRFGQPGATLTGGGTSIGDLTIGPSLQFAPVMGATGPLYSQRLELSFLLPTGHYNRNNDLNQGAGYYSINPYWAATLLPAPRWEISWRLHYLYNFKNTQPAGSAPLAYQGQTVRDTQAGQAAWINLTTSYEVMRDVRLGLNSYYFKQLTDSKTNGMDMADSREQVLGVGLGAMFTIHRGDKRDALWINSYTESHVRNRTRNSLIVQARYAYEF